MQTFVLFYKKKPKEYFNKQNERQQTAFLSKRRNFAPENQQIGYYEGKKTLENPHGSNNRDSHSRTDGERTVV